MEFPALKQLDQSSDSGLMWQQLTRQANQHYMLQDLGKAWVHYEKAMAEASDLLGHFQETGLPLSVPAAFVVSCHNLADLLFRQKENEKAHLFLHRACVELIRLAGLPGLPLRARLACVEQLQPAVVALMERVNPSLSVQQETQELVIRARTAALSVYQIAGYAVQTRLEDAPTTGRPS